MSEPSQPSPDLATIDLSQAFAPAWAKGGESSKKMDRLIARHDRAEDKPRRDRGDRRPPPRKGPKRDRDSRPPREERHGPEPIAGWEVRFLPDKHGVDGLAKQIKTTAKAYPLFDLAQLVLEKSERYLVEFKRIAGDAPAIFQLKIDGSLWTSEREAVAHALSEHLGKFYRRESIETDPPKGNFTSVAVCGMSGTLLGPSSHHDYPAKLVRLHAAKFANMPFEAFKSRIRMARDEETIERWKLEQSARDVYFPIEEKPQSAEVPVPENAAASEEDSVPAPEPVEAAAEDVVTEETPMEAEPASEVETPGEEDSVPEQSSGRLESLAEVEEDFRKKHAARCIVQIRERVLTPGSPAMNSSSAAIHTLARNVWDQHRRFPLPIAHILGQQLTGRGLQIFKAHENITYVSIARPRFLDRAASPVSDALSAMLTYIEEHPGVPRAEQWKALIAQRPAPAEDMVDVRETAVAADLSWLLHEGHVVDFAKRGLEAAKRPKPPKEPKSAPAAPAVTGEAAVTPETPVPAEPSAQE